MITAIDTNVLSWLLFSQDNERALAISDALQTQKSKGGLVVCGLVYAELMAIGPADELRVKLREMRIDVDPIFNDAVYEAAGVAWGRYLHNRRQTGGRGRYHCECGGENAFSCQHCGRPVGGPKHIYVDFLIGAHAIKRAEALLTYDRGVYRAYFPDLRLIEPSMMGR